MRPGVHAHMIGCVPPRRDRRWRCESSACRRLGIASRAFDGEIQDHLRDLCRGRRRSARSVASELVRDRRCSRRSAGPASPAPHRRHVLMSVTSGRRTCRRLNASSCSRERRRPLRGRIDSLDVVPQDAASSNCSSSSVDARPDDGQHVVEVVRDSARRGCRSPPSSAPGAALPRVGAARSRPARARGGPPGRRTRSTPTQIATSSDEPSFATCRQTLPCRSETSRSGTTSRGRGHVLRRVDLFDRHPKELVARIAVRRDSRIVHGEKAQRDRVEDPHRTRMPLEEDPVARLGAAELFLRLPPLVELRVH